MLCHYFPHENKWTVHMDVCFFFNQHNQNTDWVVFLPGWCLDEYVGSEKRQVFDTNT